MNGADITRDMMIADVLGGCASTIVPGDSGQWTIKQGRSCKIDVDLGDGWLTLRASLPRDALGARNVTRLAVANATITGPSRIAFAAGDNAPHLRADVALDATPDLERVCRNTVSGLLADRNKLRGTTADTEAEPPRAAESTNLLSALRESCQETGWSPSGRERGPLMVNLGVPGGNYQAAFHAFSERDIRLSVTLAQLDTLSDVSRVAIATFILSANRVVRFVRGAMTEIDGGARCLFEVRFSNPPSARALDRALGALSAASHLLGKAPQCLADAEVSRNFLAVRGIDPTRPPFSLRGGITQPPKQARRRKKCQTKTPASHSA